MMEVINETREKYKLRKQVRELNKQLEEMEQQKDEWKNKYYKRLEDTCDIFKQNETLIKTAKYYKDQRDKLRRKMKEMDGRK